MNKIVTIYRGDVKSRINDLRRSWGAGSKPPTGEVEAAWMRGYTAACNEIDLAIRNLSTFIAEIEDG